MVYFTSLLYTQVVTCRQRVVEFRKPETCANVYSVIETFHILSWLRPQTTDVLWLSWILSPVPSQHLFVICSTLDRKPLQQQRGGIALIRLLLDRCFRGAHDSTYLSVAVSERCRWSHWNCFNLKVSTFWNGSDMKNVRFDVSDE